MARAHSSSSMYQISTLPSQIIMSMGLQQAARPQTASTAPMIFSHLALDFFAAGDRMALRRAFLAPARLAPPGGFDGYRPDSGAARRSGASCLSLPKSLTSSITRAMGHSPTANSTTMATQTPTPSCFFLRLGHGPQSSFCFSFRLLPCSSTT